MKTIWITGGKGFIGRNLAQYLGSQQCRVFGIGHGFWAKQEYQKWSYEYWSSDKIKFSNLDQLASQSGLPHTIFHLAGGAAVGPSIENPYDDFQRTVDTTARLLDWVRQAAPITKVVGASSAAVYGAKYAKSIKESAIAQPFSPYGFHKYMYENLFSSYRDTYDLDLSVVRFFSVYGPGLEKQLLWDLCRKLSNSKDEITLNGTGSELRDWLHIQDAVDLLWRVANVDKPLTIINGGTGVATSIKEVATKVIHAWGAKHSLAFNHVARKGDPQCLLANMEIASKLLKFEPKVLLVNGVPEVVKWYKANVI